MNDGTMPAGCQCECMECKSGSCATCSHMNTPEGCDCDGCTCPMHKEKVSSDMGGGAPMPTPAQTEPVEPPMSM